MAQIDELERRIVSAFERIGQGVDALEAKWTAEREAAQPQIDPGEMEALKAALEEERTANAALEERLRVLSERHDTQGADQDKRLEDLRAAMLRLESELQRLKVACDLLRDQNEALRKANAEHVGAPHLVNMSLMAELEALRAERAAEKAEIAGVLTALTPMLDDGAADAAENEETA